MKKNFSLSWVLLVLGIALIICGGYDYYKFNVLDTAIKNSGPLPPPGLTGDAIPSCSNLYPGIQQYFQCSPHSGYVVLLIGPGLILLVCWFIWRNKSNGKI